MQLVNKFKITFRFISSHPLTKKHPFRAVLRFIFWQLQTLFVKSKFIKKTFIGSVCFYARKGLAGITGNIYTGLHEFNDMSFLLHFLKKEDTFYDVGSNVGSYTLLAAGVCKANVVAIEPILSTFEILESNILLNNLMGKVTLINKGVGAADGEIVFTVNQDTTNHVAIDVEKLTNKTTIVGIITIDSLLANGYPELIKIDVEGYENEVIKGMNKTLSSNTLKAIIIELNGSGMRYGFNDDNIHNILLSKGFKTYSYDPITRNLSEDIYLSLDNRLYCRDIEYVNLRLKEAISFEVMGELI